MTPEGRTHVRLDYASPTRPAPPSDECYDLAIGCWRVAAAGGVAIVACAALTRWQPLAIVGLFWLAVGGIVTFAGACNGAAYWWHAHRAGYPAPHTCRRAIRSLLLPLSNLPLALLCMLAGAATLGGSIVD